jgi:thiol peroxidase
MLAPNATLVGIDLSEHNLSQYLGQHIILNIFPSIDTPTCATSVKRFNAEAASLPNTKVLCISKDLPFAMKRFCAAENIENVMSLSDFRDGNFGATYGVTMTEGILKGLHARAVVVINHEGRVTHTELVEKIGDEPNYNAALKALNG